MKKYKILSILRTFIAMIILFFLLFLAIRTRYNVNDLIGVVFIMLLYIISTILILKNKIYAQFFSIFPAAYLIYEGSVYRHQILNTTYVGILLLVFEFILFGLIWRDIKIDNHNI